MAETALSPRAEPLFTIELGANGGRLAPASLPELIAWLQKEQATWAWIANSNQGNHEQGFRHAFGQLSEALSNAQQAQQYNSANPQHAAQCLDACKTQIRETFVTRMLPHSGTPLAHRVQTYQKEVGTNAASYLLAAYMPPDQGYQIQPTELKSWRGLVEGLLERFQLVPASAKSRKQAADQSFEQLRIKAETLVADKTAIYDELHRDYVEVTNGIRTTATAQSVDFTEAQQAR